MPDPFDPYHKWLGIPAEEQPPNHYRLLGVPLFESDPSTIEYAADQRMAHLRTLQAGPQGALSQELLNQVAAARVCLLHAEKKAAYDEELRRQLEAHAEAAQPAPPPLPPIPPPPPPPREAHGLTVAAGHAAADQPTATWGGLGQLGEYQLLEKLGEGGMGTVYKAVHTKLKKIVALKVLPKDRLWDQRAVARFEREMQAAGAVDDTNVVRAMDAREVEGTRFLVMEFVDGLDLGHIVHRCHPLAVADACELARQAALGLQAAHEHGLVHRDVKPSNLILSRKGQVKLLDLGLARFEMERGPGDEVTASGTAIGTLEYMAPEQLSDSRLVDIRADIYSLGCTLFKLLAGQAPFADVQGTAAQVAAHVGKAVPPIRRFRGDVPHDLVVVLNRMSAKDPAKRYATPAEVADALGPLCMGANLPALLARAEASRAPAAAPAQAHVATQEVSSGLTRFLQRLTGRQPQAPAAPAGAQGRGVRWAIAFGATAAAGLLLILVIAWAVSPGKKTPVSTGRVPSGARVLEGPVATPATHGYLVINWPESEQAGASLEVDGKAIRLRPGGGKYACEPGSHRVRATRPGFKPYEMVARVRAGEERAIRPVWEAQACIVLDWPAAEREDARLEIDGKEQDVAAVADPAQPDQIRVLTEEGQHKVWIARRGFQPFVNESVILLDGQTVTLKPEWQPAVGQASPPVPPETNPPVGQASPPVTPPPPPPPPSPEELAAQRELERQRQLEARYAEATKPVEALAAAWDFVGAAVELNKVRFEEAELTARLAQRRQELKRMHDLKQKLIAAINRASPPLEKGDLGIRGLGGQVTKAGEDGFTATLRDGKTETVPWSGIGPNGLPKLFGPKQFDRLMAPATAEDWLAAGLVALTLASGSEGERCLAQARSLGTNTDSYLSSLAAAGFAEANALLDDKKFPAAEAALAALEQKYASTPWFTSHKPAVTAARAQARAGIREAEAEKLYQEAADLFVKQELFDVKPLVDKLKTDYATTRPVTDATRKPSFTELEQSTANLGRRLIVRQDGKGEFTTIQAAIDAARSNSLIEIADQGPFTQYNEKIEIGKEGLTIRGKKATWPIITSVGRVTSFSKLVTASAGGTTIERLVLAHGGGAGSFMSVLSGDFRVRSAIIYDGRNEGVNFMKGSLDFETCVLSASPFSGSRAVARDCLWLAGYPHEGCFFIFTNVLLRGITDHLAVRDEREFSSCTICAPVVVRGARVRLIDCIAPSLQSSRSDTVIKFCNVYGDKPYIDLAKPDATCFREVPVFMDPNNFDYRLRMPLRGKASDGGQVGCRYTPEMMEVLIVALELRRRGIIKF